MIESEKLDGVIVATPDHTHTYISVYAMKHGLHVYCEKPLTQTVREARVMARVAAEAKVATQMGTQSSASPDNMRTVELIQSGVLGEITEIHLATDRPIWPQGYERLSGEDPVPKTLDWDLFLGPAARRPYKATYPAGHMVYGPEKKKQSEFEIAGLEPVPPRGVVYHPFVWRGWKDFGSGALGDIAPHAMNVIFWALDLGAPAAVEVLETSGMTQEMDPDWSVLRFDWPQRGVHPPLSIYWYDGGKKPPEEITGGKGGMVWIGTKGSLPAGRGPFAGTKVPEYERPEAREWNRKGVYEDWVAAAVAGTQAPCHFGYAGPFTEAYQLGNIALRVGHRVEWDPLAFRITNCREANQYLHKEERQDWELKKIAGSAWSV
jgi:predicted dehydrogenase